MERELDIPEFLEEDADTIHERMLENAPPEINLVEGDIFWDATRPTAEEKAAMLQLQLQNVLKIAFPQTSYGKYLEFLGEMKDVYKNPPTKSSGYLKVKGDPGSVIPKDIIIYTESTDQLLIGFKVMESKEIDVSGEVDVYIECNVAGTIGNVAADTIKIPENPVPGITSITNLEPITGGTNEEDEEAFRERVLASYDESLSGADSDYIRWAKEVPGVGQVYVMPEWEGFGTGTTKILIMDSNGQPANSTLISNVQDYISPIVEKNRGGFAPVNASVIVSAPIAKIINVNFGLILKEGYEQTSVVENIKKNIQQYLKGIEIITDNSDLEYVHIENIGHAIMSAKGVKLYSDLTINGAKDPIQIPIGEVAVLGDVIVT